MVHIILCYLSFTSIGMPASKVAYATTAAESLSPSRISADTSADTCSGLRVKDFELFVYHEVFYVP